MNFDKSPIPSDWTDISLLFHDMQAFGKKHPNAIFINADDPGYNNDPPRSPRLGWVAYEIDENGKERILKEWTIKLQDIRNTYVQNNKVKCPTCRCHIDKDSECNCCKMSKIIIKGDE